MTQLLRRRDLLNFVICFLLSLVFAVLINCYFKQDFSNAFSNYFYILIIGFPAIFQLAIIYFIYLVVSAWLFSKQKNLWTNVIVTVILTLLYVAIVSLYEWYISKSMFYTFADFLKDGNVYIVFTIISVVQLDLRRRSNEEAISNETNRQS
jgi:hypothetical protein